MPSDAAVLAPVWPLLPPAGPVGVGCGAPGVHSGLVVDVRESGAALHYFRVPGSLAILAPIVIVVVIACIVGVCVLIVDLVEQSCCALVNGFIYTPEHT